MKPLKHYLRDALYPATSVLLTLILLAPAVLTQSAYAAGQFSPRKLTMSSQAAGGISTDANGATVAKGSGGNGAFAKHTYDFTTATTGAIQSVLLQYCTTPLLDTTCTAPTGMDASTVATIAAQSGVTGFTLDTTTSVTTGNYFTSFPCVSRAHCITLQRTGGASVPSATALDLAFGQGAGTDWIKNPTSLGTFYVRIYTFSNTTYTTANMIDEAAVAGSVNTDIDLTAKVQEKLNFSVAGNPSAPGVSCTALSGVGTEQLGDTNGVLDATLAWATNSYFRLSTNANGGTLVQYSGDTLKTAGGTNSIAPIGATAVLSTPGTEQFGLGIDSSDTQGSNGYSFTNLVAAAQYNSSQGNINTPTIAAKFAFLTSSVTTPVTIASAPGGTTVSCDTGSVRYVGNIATTTKAGVYKTTIAYIAVATF
jgi:hypothetical protein